MPIDPTKCRLLRQARGLTTRELAERIGGQNPTISRIEMGHNRNVTLATAERLARALGVQVQDLLEDRGR